METYKLFIRPGDLELEVLEGITIMKALNEAGLAFDFPCGGVGKCGKCRIHVVKGLTRPTNTETELLDDKDLEQGIRLACVTRITGETSIELPNLKKKWSTIF